MATQITHIANCNVFVNGNNLFGQAEEVKLPELDWNFEQFKALGMIGTPEHPTGLNPLEASIKWNSYYADTVKRCANPWQSWQINIYGSLDYYTPQGRASQRPLKVFMTAKPKKMMVGEFKGKEKSSPSVDLAVDYIKIEENGEDWFEIDVAANIWKVDGVDLLAQYRRNLGL